VLTVHACANHVGNAVQLLQSWAKARLVGRGYLLVFAVDGTRAGADGHGFQVAASFPFASIPLGSQ
jgi:hypothetical protein